MKTVYMDKATIIVIDFNTAFSIHERTGREQIITWIREMETTQLPIDRSLFRTLCLIAAEHTSQVQVEHLSMQTTL